MSFSSTPSFSDVGHVAIVTKSSVNSSGSGSITVTGENQNSVAGFSGYTDGTATMKVGSAAGLAPWTIRSFDSSSFLDWFSVASPTISAFTATPSSLGSAGGSVTLSAQVSNASSCAFSSKPAITGLPATIACSNGTVNDVVTTPANTNSKSMKYTFYLSVSGISKTLHTMMTVGPQPWAIEPAPTGQLMAGALSCPSTTFCMGTWVSSFSEIATWNEKGTNGWRTINLPSSLPSPEVTGLTCVTASDCFAVGQSSQQSFAARWNGSSWAVEPQPEPFAQTESIVQSVSCTSSVFCLALGQNWTGSGWQTDAERWNGSDWQLVLPPTAVPPGSNSYGVSCLSPTFCAVEVPLDTLTNLLEIWNGTIWVDSVSESNYTFEVDCTSTIFCMALTPETTFWNGTIWATLSSVPDGASYNRFACSSRVFCLASWYDGYSTWNGLQWQSGDALTLVPTGATRVDLEADACPSAHKCVAIGIALNDNASPVTYTPVTEVYTH